MTLIESTRHIPLGISNGPVRPATPYRASLAAEPVTKTRSQRIQKKDIAALLRLRPISRLGLVFRADTHGTDTGIAIIVPKATAAHATVRNRLRRRVREALRHLSAHTQQPYRCVVTVRTRELPPASALERTLLELIRESGILIR